jgi:VanZ family protein
VGPRLKAAAPALAYAALIFFLSSQSSFPVPKGIWTADKLLHCVEYAVLGALTARALAAFGRGGVVPLAWLLAALYGVSDELHQSLVPGRSAEVLDAVAAAAGALLGVLLFHAWRRRRAT